MRNLTAITALESALLITPVADNPRRFYTVYGTFTFVDAAEICIRLQRVTPPGFDLG